ncbi:MAG: TonB-dependent receptor [Cyclobacteriaceae bacterium]|nr:TonB-dependent receptor [Cyclobacteriaceae bacterium HetDA_MAG_MS6]
MQLCKLTGIVVDDQTSSPLEFATISVFNSTDSSLVSGSITNVNGAFSLQVQPGTYSIRIQFVTYQSLDMAGIEVRRGQQVDLGEIALKVSTTELAEVVIQGERTQVELNLDKKVYNVGKDLSNLGGSASDILSNLPSVAVDVEGNVSLRGSENVRILIDGKPSGLVGLSSADALRQLQGNMVERVEIVTNPSARYDAQGLAGIINIVLKKEQSKGVNGSFQLNTGVPHNHGLSYNLNFRKQWVNMFSSVGVAYRKMPGKSETYQVAIPSDSSFTSKGDRLRGGIAYNTRAGADFYIDDKSTITLAFLYRFSDDDNTSDITYNDFDSFNQLFSNSFREDEESEDDKSLEYSINYTKTFAKKGRKLAADIQFQNNNEVEQSDIVESIGLPGESLVPFLYQRSENDEGEKRWLFQVDYLHPFSQDKKIELGFRSTIRKVHNDYLVEEQDSDGIFQRLPELSNDFTYDENVTALYAIFGDKKRKLSYQLGARMEKTDIRTELEEQNDENTQDYLNIFPSVHFTYELSKTNSLQLSYSKRINRPRFRYLNPFTSISNARSFWTGNPRLEPEFTDSYELGYLSNGGDASIYYGLYYRHTEGVIQRIVRVDEEGIRFTQPENLSTRDAIGLEINVSREFNSWYRIAGNINFFNSQTTGSANNQSLSAETLTFMTRISNNFKVKGLFDAQLNVRYIAPQNIPQGRRLQIATVDLGFSRDIWKRNGTMALSIRDIFNSRKYRSETSGDNFFAESLWQRSITQVTFSLSYRLNQKKQKGRRGNTGEGYEDGGGGF